MAAASEAWIRPATVPLVSHWDPPIRRPTMPEYEYKVVPFYEGCTGTLNEGDLSRVLNEETGEGWRFKRSIREQRRVFLLWTREEHFLIFEREISTASGSEGTESTSFSSPS